ncbi:uncharacterized protein A4U43_C05F16840 [Asparagus officinalis]|uniref:SHSP domain-containing protein n=2 Tax=Asparagus officinalis TaxID=4686 RepID=A0A5P1EST3_ASPOF|nr:uncharacterized protein A4U43_C05F16840 [Asparagus officinalis]
MARAAPRSYEDFQPSFKWIKEDESNTIVINLPGFRTEDLKVQRDNFGNLRVSGERPLSRDRWSRFCKDFHIPDDTKKSEIRAIFENGNLSVILPKLGKTTQSQTGAEPHKVQDKPTKAPEIRPSKKPAAETEPKHDQDRLSRKDEGIVPRPRMKQKDGIVQKQPSQKIEETSKRGDEKEEVQSRKPEDRKEPMSDTGDEDAELSKSRKRKAIMDQEVNVGVSAVILVGLAFYMSYKLRRSIIAGDDNLVE